VLSGQGRVIIVGAISGGSISVRAGLLYHQGGVVEENTKQEVSYCK